MSLSLPGDNTSIQEAALLYATAGLAPLPVHGLSNGRCTCGGDPCAAAGKHPKESKGWIERATIKPDAVAKRFHGHSGNIGIHTGFNGIVVVDADGKTTPGAAPSAAKVDSDLAELARRIGLSEMPPTLTALSGSGVGKHLVYRLLPGQRLGNAKTGLDGLSIDMRGERGQIVAAPSLHKSGGRYRWVDLREPVLIPQALYALLTSAPTAPRRERSEGPVSDGQRDVIMKRLRGILSAENKNRSIQGDRGSDVEFNFAREVVGNGLAWDDMMQIMLEHNSLCDPAWTEEQIAHKLRSAERHGRSTGLPERPLGLPPIDSEGLQEWANACAYSDEKDGSRKLRNCIQTWRATLQLHPDWRGRVRLDQFAQNIHLKDPPFTARQVGGVAGESRYWSDDDELAVEEWFESRVNLKIPHSQCSEMVKYAARANIYHSAQEWITTLPEWDKMDRVAQWLTTYFGAEDSEYTRSVGRWWLVSGVARLMKPGCKADSCLILTGGQGKRKSTALRMLAPTERWYSEDHLPIGQNDVNAAIMLQGKFIIELSEMEILWRARSNAVKGFLSKPFDHYVPKFSNRSIDVMRSCIFAGTTNEKEFLIDATGARRFWPVFCAKADIENLVGDRDQLWAQALSMYRAGHEWWPDTAQKNKMCEEEQSLHQVPDEWDHAIAKWIEGAKKESITTSEVATEALRIPIERVDRRVALRIGPILRQNGYDYAVTWSPELGKPTRSWRLQDTTRWAP